MWGCRTTGVRGRMIEDWVKRININLLNDGTQTRISGTSENALDLSLLTRTESTDTVVGVFIDQE